MSGVSIHAPARGATIYRAHKDQRICVSIHAPARGATLDVGKRLEKKLFQSTRPRGARHESQKDDTYKMCFNPRAREGRDWKTWFGGAILNEFQSTRPRGARHPVVEFETAGSRFNPRAREGRDTRESIFHRTTKSFNPRAREGRDCLSVTY